MARRHDDRPITRRGPSRQPKIRILVVCEGKKTEPRYLKQFQLHVRNPRVHIESLGPAGVPISVVERAMSERKLAEAEVRRQRDENLRWDQVWAVFDIDAPRPSDGTGSVDDNIAASVNYMRTALGVKLPAASGKNGLFKEA